MTYSTLTYIYSLARFVAVDLEFILSIYFDRKLTEIANYHFFSFRSHPVFARQNSNIPSKQNHKWRGCYLGTYAERLKQPTHSTALSHIACVKLCYFVVMKARDLQQTRPWLRKVQMFSSENLIKCLGQFHPRIILR